MLNRSTWLLVALTWWTGAACDGGEDDAPAIYHCDVGKGRARWQCFEWQGEPEQSTQQQCAQQLGGDWAPGPCNREELVGGCRFESGSMAFTVWEGGNISEEVIAEDCGGLFFYVPGGTPGSP